MIYYKYMSCYIYKIFTFMFMNFVYLVNIFENYYKRGNAMYINYYNNHITSSYFYNSNGRKQVIYNNIGFINKFKYKEGQYLFEVNFINDNEMCRYVTKKIDNIHPRKLLQLTTNDKNFKNKNIHNKRVEFVELNGIDITNAFSTIAYLLNIEKITVNDIAKLFDKKYKTNNNYLKITNDELDEFTFKDSQIIRL